MAARWNRENADLRRIGDGGWRFPGVNRIEGSNPSPSATLKSLLCKGYSGHSMDSNLSRKFGDLPLMRPAVVAC